MRLGAKSQRPRLSIDDRYGCDKDWLLAQDRVRVAQIEDASMLHRDRRLDNYLELDVEDGNRDLRRGLGVIFARATSRPIISGELCAERDVTPA